MLTGWERFVRRPLPGVQQHARSEGEAAALRRGRRGRAARERPIQCEFHVL